MTKQRTITLTDRAPVKIDEETWDLIAQGDGYQGQYDFQAFDGAWIKVRRHPDGRTIVYGYAGDWDGGGRPERESIRAGFLVTVDETVETIGRVADILSETAHAGEYAAGAARRCIADLPAEKTRRIRVLAGELVALLDDPHPGLFTWRDFLVTTSEELHQLLGEKLGKS